MSITAGTYYFINKKATGSALDLSGGDNKSIIGYGLHDGDNQKWTLEQVGSSWQIKNYGLGSFLTIDGDVNNAGDGTKVIAAQNRALWDISDEQDPNYHRIFLSNTNFNIDLSDHGNPTPGTPVELWSKWNGDNQIWKFVKA